MQYQNRIARTVLPCQTFISENVSHGRDFSGKKTKHKQKPEIFNTPNRVPLDIKDV